MTRDKFQKVHSYAHKNLGKTLCSFWLYHFNQSSFIVYTVHENIFQLKYMFDIIVNLFSFIKYVEYFLLVYLFKEISNTFFLYAEQSGQHSHPTAPLSAVYIITAFSQCSPCHKGLLWVLLFPPTSHQLYQTISANKSL